MYFDIVRVVWFSHHSFEPVLKPQPLFGIDNVHVLSPYRSTIGLIKCRYYVFEFPFWHAKVLNAHLEHRVKVRG